jgi:hypothetical protein
MLPFAHRGRAARAMRLSHVEDPLQGVPVAVSYM